MLGLLALDPERIARLVTAMLSVLGGYLAGFILFGMLAYFADRWFTGGKSPAGMHTAARHVGGVAGALLVALIVFGGIGDGDGPGAGGAVVTGSGPGTGTGVATPATSSAPNDPEIPPAPVPEKPVEAVVQVTVLSGSEVRDQRFYLIDQDAVPRNLDEVKERVRARSAGPEAVSIAIRLAARTDRNNSGVLDLENWARAAGMRVILPRKE